MHPATSNTIFQFQVQMVEVIIMLQTTTTVFLDAYHKEAGSGWWFRLYKLVEI
jgi:hypothetical protein